MSVIRLSIDKIRRLGWRPTRTSAQALSEAMLAMRADLEAGCDQGGETVSAPVPFTALSAGLAEPVSLGTGTCSGTVRQHPDCP